MEYQDLPAARQEPEWCTLFPQAAADESKDEASTSANGAELIYSMGRADLAVHFAEFCWPSFVVIDDMVLRGYVSDELKDAAADWLEHRNGDKAAVEWVLNHEHFWHMAQGGESLTPEAALHWGRLVREMWSAKLARDYPDRQFIVELHAGLELDVEDQQITFYQVR